MTQIPSDDILEGLYKLRKRESEKLRTVLELYNMEIHQKAGHDYHRLKTMVKRSIEQNLRIQNFEARNGNCETNAVVKNQGTKQREQRTLGDCWQWNANGQCSKGDKRVFQDSDFAGDLEDSKSTSGGTLCVFGSRTFVCISWMCKKQTSVSHSSTESEIISLDASLRLDGTPALDLWDLIVAVLGNTNQSNQAW